MKKYLNQRFAMKLLITGSSLYVVSFIFSLATVFKVYDKVDECLGKTANCTFGTEQIVSKIALFVGYAGLGILVAGLVVLLIVTEKKIK